MKRADGKCGRPNYRDARKSRCCADQLAAPLLIGEGNIAGTPKFLA